jgi:chaperonin GroEL
MPKMMLFGEEARAALGRGVATLTRAVETTLGPKGGNAIIDVPIGTPIVSRDGVSIAAEIELEDRFENMGAQVVREVSKRTNEVAGDGTTTATVLANALIQEGFGALADRVSAVELVEGMELAIAQVLEALKKSARPIAERDEAIASVAVIAANDVKTGRMVADALQRVGPTGIVNVDIGLTVETTVDVVEGASYERGYISHHMVTDVDDMQVVLDDVAILLTDQPLESEGDVAGLRALVGEVGKPLLVIAESYSPQAVAALLRESGGPAIVAVHPPEYGKWRQAMMEDIAIMTGGRVFVEDLGDRFQDARSEDLGAATAVRISADQTVISGGRGDPDRIRGRVEQIRRQLELNEVPIEEDKFNDRLAKMSGGIAVIHAGGATPVEQKRRAQLIEDALNATRAAIEEGVVAGGGTALVEARPAVDRVAGELAGGIKKGAEIVKAALARPLACIARNSGADAEHVVEGVARAETGVGYDARTGEMVDMIGAGIADPVKVTCQALINAASVASLILTTQTLIADTPDEDDPTAGPARGGGAELLGRR